MIIDAHVHLYKKDMLPEQWWHHLVVFISKALRMPLEMMKKSEPMGLIYNPTSEALIKEMDEAGIDKSIAFSIDWGLGIGEPKRPITEANKYVADAVKKYPDRIIGFAAIDPRRKNALEIVKQGIDQGLSGIKLHPTAGFYPNSPESYKIFEYAAESNLPVISHTGIIGSGLKGKYAKPIHFDDVMGDFPDLRLSLAHLGMGWYEELAMLMGNYPSLYADISAFGQQLNYSTKRDLVRIIRYFLNRAGERTLFGSDWPYFNLILSNKGWVETVQSFNNEPNTTILKNLGYSKIMNSEIKNLLGKNALNFLQKT